MEAIPPATPRHTIETLPLLPSGPGGVHVLSLRGDRQDHHNRARNYAHIPANGNKCLKNLYFFYRQIQYTDHCV
jgi:hypothetical protein